MINHFTFNGTSTAQLGLIVSGVSIFGAGSRKVEKAGIPGRNGDLQIELGGFNNYTVRYTVSITKNFTTTAQQIREWLLEAKGYCDLTDTYHPDEIRKACFNSDIEFTTSMLYKYGQASIQFDCLPERYLTTNTPITTTATADTTTDTTMSLSTVPTPLNISLNGNTTQEGSSGKNLIPFPYAQGSRTAEGITWTVASDNKITATGTTTAGTNFILTYRDSYSLPAGTYTLSFTGTHNGMNLQVYDGSGILARIYPNQTSATFTTTATKGIQIYFNIGTASTAVNISGYPQLEKGSSATTWEPHISPTNPQVIHNVSGDNEITVVNKNLFDIENDYVNTKFSLSGGTLFNTATDTKTYFHLSILALNGNTVVSVIYSTSFSTTGEKSVTFNSGDLSNVTRLRLKHNGSSNDLEIAYVEKSSLTANTSYTLSFNLISNNPTTVNGLIISNIQLEKGSTATTYEPYTRQSYPLYLPVENLLPKATTSTLYGVTFTVADDGTITTSGTATAIIYYPVAIDLSLPSDTYTLSGSPKGASNNTMFIYTTPNYHSDYGEPRTFTDTVDKVYIYVASGQNMDGKVFKPQIEKGSKANHYTPYGTTPIELNGIGTYSDYIYKNGGKWYVHKEFEKVDLGSLMWEKQASSTLAVGYYFQTTSVSLLASTVAWLCSSYPNTGYSGISNIISALGNGVDKIGFSAGGQYFYVIDSTYTDARTFKTAVNGVELVYRKRTATNTEITDTTLINQLNNIEKAYSYNGTTNILQVSNDNGFMLEVVSLHGSTFNSNYKGEPIITANATGLIYLNGEVMEVLSAPVTINCQTMQCYNGVINMNNEVRVNDFPEIKIGVNEVGSSMALTITPNNWRH